MPATPMGPAEMTQADLDRLGPNWNALADKLELPVICIDYQVTRRQRIHVGILPHTDDPYTSTLLMQVLEFCWERGYDNALVVYDPRKGSPLQCQIAFAPRTTGETDNG